MCSRFGGSGRDHDPKVQHFHLTSGTTLAQPGLAKALPCLAARLDIAGPEVAVDQLMLLQIPTGLEALAQAY